MTRYYAQTEGHIMPTYRRGGAGRANLDGSSPVLGRIGTSAPEGYVQTGTTIKSNKAGEKTFAIYTPIDQVKAKEETVTTPEVEEPTNLPEINVDPAEPAQPTNPYQGQIDELTTQIGTISGQIGGYTDTINSLNKQIENMQTNFGKQLETIMAANTKALEDMNTQYQEQMRQQQEAAETARRQRELAAQTAAANQARAAQGQADLQMGSGIMRGIFSGGLAGFKRRGKVKLSTSDALSIAGNKEKSPNKMLNV